MRYRLGLDVGTASLAAVAVSLDTHNKPLDLVWRAVRIFPEPLKNDQGRLKSKKAARREARIQRRQIDRRRSRARRVVALGRYFGLNTQSTRLGSSSDIPRLRATAARERIEAR